MTFSSDLSPHDGPALDQDQRVLNIGWLDALHEFNRGETSIAFIERLWAFCCTPVLLSRGFHICKLCDEASDLPTVERHGEQSLVLGAAEIRVFDKDGSVYASPDLIYHYVTHHGYKPPDRFIQAVLAGPMPDSLEFRTLLHNLCLSTVEPLHEVVTWKWNSPIGMDSSG